MDKVVVAIGGGDIYGWNFKTKDDNQTEYNLKKIDTYIRNLSSKENPKMLFVGTATKENPAYYNAIKNIYEDLGCSVENLQIIGNDNIQEIKSMVLNSDIIYIGGGNTRFMLSEWERVNLKNAILEAYNNGVIIAGYSAGTYALFNTNYEGIDGFNIIDAVVCVHYNEKSEEKRNQFFERIKLLNKPGYALDNSTALIYKNSEVSIIRETNDVNGYKFICKNDIIEKKEI